MKPFLITRGEQHVSIRVRDPSIDRERALEWTARLQTLLDECWRLKCEARRYRRINKTKKLPRELETEWREARHAYARERQKARRDLLRKP